MCVLRFATHPIETLPHRCIVPQTLHAKLQSSHSIGAATNGGGCAAGSFSYATSNDTQHAAIATRAVIQATLDHAAYRDEPLLILLCPGTLVSLCESLRIDTRSFVGIECAAPAAVGINEPHGSSSRTENVLGGGRSCVISSAGFSGPLVRVASSEAMVSFDGLVFKARQSCCTLFERTWPDTI